MRRRFASALTGFLVAAFVSAPAQRPDRHICPTIPVPTDPGHWEIYNYVTGFNGGGGLQWRGRGSTSTTAPPRTSNSQRCFPSAWRAAKRVLPHGFRAWPGDYRARLQVPVHPPDRRARWAPDVSRVPPPLRPHGEPVQHRPRQPVPAGLGAEGRGALVAVRRRRLPDQPGPGPAETSGREASRSAAPSASDFTLGRRRLYGQGRTTSEPPGGGYTALNLATTYRLTPHWSLLASAGPTWEGRAARHGQVFYVSLKADY